MGDEGGTIVERLRAGRCVLCVGSRLGGATSYAEVVATLFTSLTEVDARAAQRLLSTRPLVAAGHVRRKMRSRFAVVVADAIRIQPEPPPVLARLAEFPWRAVLTTSYGPSVARVFADGGPVPVLRPSDPEPPERLPGGRFVYELLGGVDDPGQLLFSVSDVNAAALRGAFRLVRELYDSRSFVFVGFEAGDPDLDLVLDRILEGGRGAPGGPHFALVPGLVNLERDELAAVHGLRTLDGDPLALADMLRAALGNGRLAVVPDEDDLEGWLALWRDDPSRSDAALRLEEIAGRMRARGEWERLVDYYLERADLEPDADSRAAFLRELADVFDQRLADPDRALTTRLAAYRAAPRREDWEVLETLAARTGRLSEVLTELETMTPTLWGDDRADAWAWIGRIYAERLGKVDEAIAALEKALALVPTHAEARRLWLEVLRRARLWDELTRALAAEASRADSPREQAKHWIELGCVHEHELGEPAQAASCYRRALELAPDSAEARTRLETVLLRRADFAALEQLFEEEGRLDDLPPLLEERAGDPQLPPAERAATWHRLGVLKYARLGDPDGAEAAWLEALEVSRDASPVPSMLALVELYRARGELARAAAMLREAIGHIEGRRERPDRLAELGRLHEELDEPERAIAAYREALTLDPEHVPAGERLAALLRAAGRWEELVPVLEMLVRRAADEAARLDHLLALAQSAAAAGDERKVLKAWAAAARLAPSRPDIQRGYGECLFAEERWAEARAAFRQVAEAEDRLTLPERADVHARLGTCALRLGDRDEARRHFEAALAIDPGHRPALLAQVELSEHSPEALLAAKKAYLATASVAEKARLLGEIGDLYVDALENPVSAMAAYRAALELAPGDHRLLHKALALYVEQKKWKRAVQAVEKLVEIEKVPAVRARLRHTAATFYRDELEDIDQAVRHLEAALDEDPTFERAWAALERILCEAGRHEALARLFARALERLGPEGPDGRNPERLRLWSRLADLYLHPLGRRAEGVTALEVVTKLQPDDAARREQLVRLYLESGDDHVDKAIAELQRLLRTDKRRLDAYRKLAELYRRTGRPERAAACADALAVLEGREPNPSASALPAAWRPLSPESFRLLTHPDEDPVIATLMATVEPLFVATMAQAPRRLGLSRKDRVTEADLPTLAALVKRVSAAFALPAPDVYLRREQDVSVTFVPCRERRAIVPAMLVGRPLLKEGLTEAELVFDLACRLAHLRPGRFLRFVLPQPAHFVHLVEAAIALAASREGAAASSRPALTATLAALERGLAPLALDQVARAGSRLREAGVSAEAAALRWLAATELTAARAAFALGIDLGTALRRLGADARLRRFADDRVADLAWSSVTDEIHAVRRHLLA